MKKPKKYYSHSDGGHGWLAVKRQELFNLGIIDKISHCSYQRGQTVYLEEDCDLQTFLNAINKIPVYDISKYDEKTTILVAESYHDVSPIRSYQPFTFCISTPV